MFPNPHSVVLTGASSGIGREMALQLAAQGACLTLAGRDSSRLEAVAELCRVRGGQAIALPTDISEPSQCRALIDAAFEKFGRIDTLINNAGITMWARFDEIQDLAPFEQIMRVNYLGSVYCTHYALPFLKQSHGRITAVCSLSARTGVPTRSAYAASKHAMAGFFDSLRIELRDYGVSITLAHPGFVSSTIRQRALGPDGRPLDHSPVQESRVMTTNVCAYRILRAAAQRKRELVMTPRGRVGLWLKLIAPALVDRIAARAIARGR